MYTIADNISINHTVFTIKGLARRRRAIDLLTLGLAHDMEELRRRHWDFMRLLAMASTDALLTIPVTATIIGLDISFGIQPWISWADTHADFDRVDLIPRMYWAMDPRFVMGVELSRWSVVVSAAVFVVIFAPAAESRRKCAQFGTFVSGLLRVRTRTRSVGSGSEYGSGSALGYGSGSRSGLGLASRSSTAVGASASVAMDTMKIESVCSPVAVTLDIHLGEVDESSFLPIEQPSPETV
jgi:hypothetical protein